MYVMIYPEASLPGLKQTNQKLKESCIIYYILNSNMDTLMFNHYIEVVTLKSKMFPMYKCLSALRYNRHPGIFARKCAILFLARGYQMV